MIFLNEDLLVILLTLGRSQIQQPLQLVLCENYQKIVCCNSNKQPQPNKGRNLSIQLNLLLKIGTEIKKKENLKMKANKQIYQKTRRLIKITMKKSYQTATISSVKTNRSILMLLVKPLLVVCMLLMKSRKRDLNRQHLIVF